MSSTRELVRSRVALPLRTSPCRHRGQQVGVSDLYHCDRFEDVAHVMGDIVIEHV